MDTKRTLQDFLCDRYQSEHLAALDNFLQENSTLKIQPLPNGLFTASSGMPQASVTGYQDFWVRDNVMIAHSFLLRGDVRTAVGAMRGLTALLSKQEKRFKKIIDDPAKKADVQERPHVRFNSSEESQNWSHAQNDALGYALWLRFVLANSGRLDLENNEFELYRLFPLYFEAIEYWKDSDSGAWEEDRKVNSSSIGAVVAGLRVLQIWLKTNDPSRGNGLQKRVEALIREGTLHLQQTLPFESPPQRRADAAVLFLIHPAEVLLPEQEDAILNLVETDLVRDIGIIRYVGDSYYGQDYPDWFAEDQLAGDFSERIDVRNAKLHPGFEAQWGLFDSLLSVIYGNRFLAHSGNTSNLTKQTHFFNRSLKQLTPDIRCPELYFFRHGKWIPNPHTPLAWAQANLALALEFMKRSATLV
jgi:hypothetical protein